MEERCAGSVEGRGDVSAAAVASCGAGWRRWHMSMSSVARARQRGGAGAAAAEQSPSSGGGRCVRAARSSGMVQRRHRASRGAAAVWIWKGERVRDADVRGPRDIKEKLEEQDRKP